MKVVILCGGKGTRLREETEYRPKPMVPIGSFPILWHIMKIYSFYGYKDFVLCLGYKGDVIREYFRNYLWNTCDTTFKLGQNSIVQYNDKHGEEDWNVTLANTGENSMTAFRVKQIQRYIPKGESFLLTYGDGLSNININDSISEHKKSCKVCTISAVHPAGRFGALRIEDDGKIHKFSEKPQFEEAYVNGGFMICNYEMFDYLDDNPDIMLERAPMEKLVKNSQLHAYRHEGFWQPMDTYQETEYLNRLWTSGKAPWKVWSS
jgi:glucose-1-phosphate cytidylyltransferase